MDHEREQPEIGYACGEVSSMKRKTFLACCFGVAVAAVGVSQETQHLHPEQVNMTADSITRQGAVTHLSGNVRVETNAVLLSADSADFDSGTREIKARGNVTVNLKTLH
jgi:lipopolysaccharide assembly outer membrane protein LptD (OstA)